MRDHAARLAPATLAAVAALALALAPLALPAQQTTPPATTPAAAPVPVFTGPDVIHGRVTDDSAHAVAAATVVVTRGPDRLVQQTTTDSTGAYRVRFADGTGDYLVFVNATGFRSVRRRVQRLETEHDFVANFQLGRDLNVLATVKVTADKPVRATNVIRPQTVETGASERWNDGVAGAISPTAAGDLGAIAGTMSNVTLGPAGPSILGGGAESNLTTLNGMGLAAGAIPRAARTETRVTGATFDPTRGGFAGANIDVRLGPGSRTYQRRNGFLTLDPSSLQFGDAASRALGNSLGGVRGSLGADGELIRQALTYNVALDVGRSLGSPATLATADADVLLRSGVAPDSVARLVAVAAPLGLGFVGRGVPDQQQHDAISWLGRLDDTRDTMSTRALSTYAGLTRDGAIGFGPLAAPTTAGERRDRTLGAQLTLGTYVGPGRRILTETRLAASAVRSRTTPYLALPGANVTVRSAGDLADGGVDATSLSLGGGPYLATDDSRWTLEGANETAWNARGRRHRFKTLLSGRVDGLRQQGLANRFGSYSYNSIEDLAAGRPSSFTRTLSQPTRQGTVWNAATALAHQWSPTRFFNLLYGARVEADGFANAPARNTALEQALGVRTGAAPARLHVSPRAGFSYTYNRDKNNGSGTQMSQVGTFYRTTTGTIRGGIGEFRDLLRPGILADASAATGLAGATSTLSCVGSAVPAADWAAFLGSPGTLPDRCLDGSGALGERAPSVTLIDPSYDVPHSWRASLDWNASIHRLLFRVGGLASYDLGQPGTVDPNFSGVRRFSLGSAEGGRPVFVSPAGIDPASGAVSAAESRRSSDFGRVGVRVSDLRGYGGQLTAGISPDVFKFRGPNSIYASLDYTLQTARRQFRGFDGAGFGDPRDKEWAPSVADARHVVVLSGGLSANRLGTFTMFARAQSGLPYTPIVGGDVNGDGRFGDRAFVPRPADAGDAALAAQLQSLLAGGAPSARRCVLANLGRVAGRGSCRGPWTSSLNLQWRPQMPSRWNGRVVPNVYFQNVLAGLDRAVHGGDGLRGWGSPTAIDPVLFVPRGFDAAAGRFRYDVNSRFGDARANRAFQRDPFRVVVDFSFNLSTDFDLQQLRRAVEPVRAPEGWRRRSADSLAAFYLGNTSSVHKLLLEESDSLFLSAGQIAALRRADSVFSARVRALYLPLGDYLAASGAGAGKAALDSAQATQKAYWKVFWQQPEVADSIVTPSQRELIPMFKEMLATPQADRADSQWQFGHPVTYSDKAPPTKPRPSSGEGVQVRSSN